MVCPYTVAHTRGHVRRGDGRVCSSFHIVQAREERTNHKKYELIDAVDERHCFIQVLQKQQAV